MSSKTRAGSIPAHNPNDMNALHNTDFPGLVGTFNGLNFYEYRGVGIFKHGKRYRIDFATGNKWVSSLEWAKRVIDSVLKHQ